MPLIWFLIDESTQQSLKTYQLREHKQELKAEAELEKVEEMRQPLDGGEA